MLAKDYKPGSRTYSTELIGGAATVVRQAQAESFWLRLKVEGRKALFSVRKDFYDSVNAGESLRVIYQRRRLTATLQVIDVRR